MSAKKIKNIIENHPLLTVILIASILRLLAVIFSKGYMASDDQFETVDVAFNWLRHGLWSPDNLLTWGSTVTRDIMRFPLYTLFLYAVMKIYYLFGVESLDTMMYGIRATHAALSLISVYSAYKIVEIVTGLKKYAIYAGLAAAAHFALPFLSVRNLIEMVGGHFWIWALLFIYLYDKRREDRYLVFAGIITGLAWMIRFEIAFAALAVPFVLYIDYRKPGPALRYSLAVMAMLLISGIVDYFLLGQFAGSTINHILQVLNETPPYQTSIFIYIGVLTAFFIPPLSLILFFISGYRSFWRRHKIIVVSTLLFIILHNLSPSRQERYMLPVIAPLIVIFTLAWFRHTLDNGFFFRKKQIIKSCLVFAVIVNMILLAPLTVNYAKKGLVEPLVKIEQVKQGASIIFITPEKKRIFPEYYAGLKPVTKYTARKWSDIPAIKKLIPAPDFFILYPPQDHDLSRYVDSVSDSFGKIVEYDHIGSSTLDYILHELNPRHNPTNEAWIYVLDKGK